MLLLYTDGAIDERGAGSERSMADLAAVVAQHDLDPAMACDLVVDALDVDRADDVALLAIQFDPQGAAAG